jgi:hypothetical protein
MQRIVFVLSLETKIYKPHSHNFSSPQNRKVALIIFSTTNPSIVAPRDLFQAHLPRQLPGHTIILRLVITRTHQIEENDTNTLMLPNISAFPLCNFPCLHVVQSKNSQPPTEKKIH